MHGGWPVAAAAMMLVVVSGCSATADGVPSETHPGVAPSPSSATPTGDTTDEERQAGDPQFVDGRPPTVRCVEVTTKQAVAATGIEGDYGKLLDARFPCGAQWSDATAWELGEGEDDLAGRPASSTVTLTYVRFADAEVARREARVATSGGDWRTVSTPVGEPAWFGTRPVQTPHGESTRSSVVAVCEDTLVTASARVEEFTLSDGRRGRRARDVAEAAMSALEDVGAQVCTGDKLPSRKIAPYWMDRH